MLDGVSQLMWLPACLSGLTACLPHQHCPIRLDRLVRPPPPPPILYHTPSPFPPARPFSKAVRPTRGPTVSRQGVSSAGRMMSVRRRVRRPRLSRTAGVSSVLW